MENVGRNQAQAVALRQEFTFHQKQLLRMNRGNGKVAREEHREYDITPNGHGVAKELLRFDGKYEYKGKYVTYDRPGYNYKDMDIDGDLIDDLSNDMTNDNSSRDGIGANLFPLTTEEQHKYNFKLLGAEKYRGRDVYRVGFEPKPHQDFDEAAWKGEAMIDAAEFQPVSRAQQAGVEDSQGSQSPAGHRHQGAGLFRDISEVRGWRMVSRELRRGVRGAGGILLQADDFGEHDEYGVSPDQRQEQRDLSGERKVIGLTAVRQTLDFGELMREHRAMVFSVLWHFLHDRDLAEETRAGRLPQPAQESGRH